MCGPSGGGGAAFVPQPVRQPAKKASFSSGSRVSSRNTVPGSVTSASPSLLGGEQAVSSLSGNKKTLLGAF